LQERLGQGILNKARDYHSAHQRGATRYQSEDNEGGGANRANPGQPPMYHKSQRRAHIEPVSVNLDDSIMK